jgi:hypothetical protein
MSAIAPENVLRREIERQQADSPVLPPKAEIAGYREHVRCRDPDGLHCSNRPLFDHLVGAAITRRLKLSLYEANGILHGTPGQSRQECRLRSC